MEYNHDFYKNKKTKVLKGHASIDDNTEDLSTELDESIIKSIDELMKQLEEAKNSPASDKLNNQKKIPCFFY